VVEPHVKQLPVNIARFGVRKATLDEALRDANIVAVLVDHEAFARVPAQKRNGAIVYDTRGIWRDAGRSARNH
jgi:UDP-N-acetyl-D-mannosaminuronic acid dehydrogenase